MEGERTREDKDGWHGGRHQQELKERLNEQNREMADRDGRDNNGYSSSFNNTNDTNDDATQHKPTHAKNAVCPTHVAQQSLTSRSVEET